MAINPEREKVIDKLEKMLEFFRHAPIKNDDSLTRINDQLDNLMCSLKYVPCEPSFDSLPTEIKTDILNYLCDSGAFVSASVSQEWKQILERNLKHVDEICVNKHCSNKHECENAKCFMPEEFLKAAVIHNLDFPLAVCHPLPDIDTELLLKGLTNVSNLSIRDLDDNVKDFVEDLFKELGQKEKIMNSLELINVNFHNLDQNKLVNYLFNKVKNLTLHDHFYWSTLDNELFVNNLLQISTDSQLERLTLHDFCYPGSDNLPKDIADALWKVQSVYLGSLPADREEETVKQLVKNIQTQNIKMKSFELDEDIDWSAVLSPEELKMILEKMDELKLLGNFTAAQVTAVSNGR